MAGITLRIPLALRSFTNGQTAVELKGATVGEVLAALTEAYPDIHAHLYDEGGKLRSFINIYVDDEDIRFLDGLNTRLEGKNRLTLVPAIAGGRGRA